MHRSLEKKVIGNHKNQQGFTLIEMAISLIIVSIFLSASLYAYTLYLTNKQSTQTLEAVSAVTTAIFQFKNANGRYPCPAPILESKDTSSTYGHETNCADLTIGTGATVPPGTCLVGTSPPKNYDGTCVESSPRLIGGVNPRVRMGAIPFRELQIDEKQTFDGYGSRLVYVVTEDMAVASTYKDSNAAIEIRDGSGNVLSGGNQSVAFLVLSPGKNRNGAVNIYGKAQPCLTATTDIDGQNCRDFTSTSDTQAIYTMDAQKSGTDQFDDIVEYFVPTGAEVWRREDKTSENIIDMSEDKVGVGITSPSQLAQDLTIMQSTVNNVAIPSTNNADIAYSANLAATNTVGGQFQNGALRVGKFTGGSQSGKILADKYCTADNSECFTTDIIAGAYDNNPTTGTSGMGCPTGQYMIGIESGHAKCSAIRIACPTGQVMTSIGSSGEPICTAPVAGCVDKNVQICGQTQTLTAAGNGQQRWIYYTTGGACARSVYQCNSGTWDYYGWASYDNAPACSYASSTAATGSNTASCGTGFTGSYTQNYFLTCDGYQHNTTDNSATNCVCKGITDNVVCSGDFGSTVVGTKQRVCTGNTLDASYSVFKDNAGATYSSESALLSAKCSCSKTDYWEFAQCSTGQERTATPNPTTFTSPTATWPADTTYGAYRKRTVDASTCTYDSASSNISNCVCATGYNYRDENPTCGSCDKIDTVGQVRQIRSGSGCGWIDDPDTSANTTGTCIAKTFIWKNSGVSAGPPNSLSAGHGVSPVCDSTCSCGESNTQSACALSTTSQWTYFSSTCLPQ
jgi:prepilin-type N-terminal cleavage/methylation domain-containing protein